MTCRMKPVALATAIAIALVSTGTAHAAAPVKFVLSGHLGWNVNKTKIEEGAPQGERNVCFLGDACRPAEVNQGAGGFEFPDTVAGAPSGGDVYIADKGNSRVQELGPNGAFVLMFGKKVNKSGGNVCTKAEESECQAGELDGSAQSIRPQSIAVDPSTGNLFLLDLANERVEEYTAGGEFVLMFGKKVNKGGGDICTKAEESECQAGEQDINETDQSGFNFGTSGNLLAVGSGPEHLLYVGSAHRIEEFDSAGEWKGEIKLPAALVEAAPFGLITAIAIDEPSSVAYVVYNEEDLVREFNLTTKLESQEHISVPKKTTEPTHILTIARDSEDHLAVWAIEGQALSIEQLGFLYEAGNGHLLTEFQTPGQLFTETGTQGISGLGFDSSGKMYAAFVDNELWRYTPESVAELNATTANCSLVNATANSTFTCTLHGIVNPFGISNTQVWFEWGKESASGCTPSVQTAKQSVAPVESEIAVSAVVEGIRPNQRLCFRLAGTDENAEPPEKLTSPIVSTNTPVAAPKALGQPNASFVTASSAVMFAELDPENASTEYFFEYVADEHSLTEICPKGTLNEECEGVHVTPAQSSEIYGLIGATIEARNLLPNTLYHYRLAVKNQAGSVVGAEGAPFTTTPEPMVQAVTGPAIAVTTTSAVLTGSVGPDGQVATYSFELAPSGDSPHFVTVVSANTGVSTGMEAESVQVTGLQPGTTYAYRVTIQSGYGTAAGATGVFTTEGLPVILKPPAVFPQLAIPSVAFPKLAAPPCARGHVRRHGRCVKAKARKKRRSKKSASRRSKRRGAHG